MKRTGRKMMLIIACLLVLGGTVFGAPQKESVTEKEIVLAAPRDIVPGEGDFFFATSMVKVWEPLVGADESWMPVPVLAESWSHNSDATEWTFQLRKGVQFHDGTNLDANVVMKNFERYQAVDPGKSKFYSFTIQRFYPGFKKIVIYQNCSRNGSASAWTSPFSFAISHGWEMRSGEIWESLTAAVCRWPGNWGEDCRSPSMFPCWLFCLPFSSEYPSACCRRPDSTAFLTGQGRPVYAAAVGILALVFIVNLFAPFLAPFDPNEIDIPRRLEAPSRIHLFGTDTLGWDVFSRVLWEGIYADGLNFIRN